MSLKKEIILAFDAYGTLLSTASIATQLADHFGPEAAQKLAAESRKYQLEYTWRLNSMNDYEPFSTVTQKAFQHALAESNLSLPEPHIANLMKAYNTLSIFPDVEPLFTHLENASHIHSVIFSNGTAAMINASLAESPDLSPHKHLFERVVVVEEVQKFKPHPLVYAHLCKEVGKEGREGEVWLVSGNPFDVVGANACGMKTCWVDRSGAGWVDRLVEGEKGRPTVVVKGLDEVVEKVEGFLRRDLK